MKRMKLGAKKILVRVGLIGLLSLSMVQNSFAQISTGCCAVCNDGSMFVAGTARACNILFGYVPGQSLDDFLPDYVCRDHRGTRSINLGGPYCTPLQTGEDYYVDFADYAEQE